MPQGEPSCPVVFCLTNSTFILLLSVSELSPHWAGYVQHLLEQGYRRSTVLPYRAAVAYFAHRMSERKIKALRPHRGASRDISLATFTGLPVRRTAATLAIYRSSDTEGGCCAICVVKDSSGLRDWICRQYFANCWRSPTIRNTCAASRMRRAMFLDFGFVRFYSGVSAEVISGLTSSAEGCPAVHRSVHNQLHAPIALRDCPGHSRLSALQSVD